MLKILSLFLMITLSLLGAPKRSKYFIAVKRNEEGALHSLSSFTPLTPPKNIFYADPMLYKHDGVNYLFFEEFDYKKGIISYVTVDQNLNFSEPRKALEIDIHLSFPHIFKDGEEIYMTPETYDAREVALYKAAPFPEKWEKVRVLVSGADFADPIVFKHNGYYWLFTAVNMDKLCIYYSLSLSSPFIPHPINKLKLLGRNAGRVFYTGDRLMRPTMDCRQGYGRSMILKEILRLDPLHFVEKECETIEPTWAPGLDGTHSYSQNEDFIVYDGRRTIFLHEDAQYSSDRSFLSDSIWQK